VDEALTSELRMLCRGLANSSFAMLATVRTVVRLPDDEAVELALRQACGTVADEFGVESAVRRDGDVWIVCFCREVASEQGAEVVRRTAHGRLRQLLAWLRGVPRPAGPVSMVRGRRG
jgi:hypothetical protein